MKYFLSAILVFSIAQCGTLRELENLGGVYSKSGKDYNYTLKLNKDSSFYFSQKYYEVNTVCHGIWQLSADTILLQCAEEDLAAKLQRGYMGKRNLKAIVLSKNKLKLGEVLLRKQ